MKHLGDIKRKMVQIQQDLDAKEEEFENMQSMNQSLITKLERRTCDEVEDARKELIKVFGSPSTQSFIGVKRMGGLDCKPFFTATNLKHDKEEADHRAAELCSLWEEYLRDPEWRPFRIIQDIRGRAKEIIDENDEMLKNLKNDWGDEVYKAVATALMEINEYNPSGRLTVLELWNFEEGRKATLKEGIAHLHTEAQNKDQNLKKENEKLQKKIIELEKRLDTRQALELEIERLKASLEVMKDDDAKKEMERFQQLFEEKEEEEKCLENIIQNLTCRVRRTDDEVQDAREELVEAFDCQPIGAFIGVKRMGELGFEPFFTAMKLKYDKEEEAHERAMELWSQWEYFLNHDWHPFKVIKDNGGKAVGIIDENDERLKNLKDEYGDEVYKAVVTALMEMNEYIPRSTGLELWNNKEGRKATLKEGVAHLLKQWTLHKRRRT